MKSPTAVWDKGKKSGGEKRITPQRKADHQTRVDDGDRENKEGSDRDLIEARGSEVDQG